MKPIHLSIPKFPIKPDEITVVPSGASSGSLLTPYIKMNQDESK
jgi:hypothetical protein